MNSVEDRAVLNNDLIEQVIKVHELLKIHRKYDAHSMETAQILGSRKEFTTALNEFLLLYNFEGCG
ncbi:MAG: hypothetical protein AAFO82_08820 [Bacteroidota bacterium]